MNFSNEDKVNELSTWCNVYGNKKHILTRSLFKKYEYRLLSKGNVTENMFRHICKYLKNDLKADDERLWKYFGSIILGYESVELATLDEFL